MKKRIRRQMLGATAAGSAAGTVSGLFGGSGGMLLIPGLRKLAGVAQEQIFPTTVAVMLPTVLTCLVGKRLQGPLPLAQALPYLPGSAVGGILAGLWGKKVPDVWLHRVFGTMILWGGVRLLWS